MAHGRQSGEQHDHLGAHVADSSSLAACASKDRRGFPRPRGQEGASRAALLAPPQSLPLAPAAPALSTPAMLSDEGLTEAPQAKSLAGTWERLIFILSCPEAHLLPPLHLSLDKPVLRQKEGRGGLEKLEESV